MASSAWSVTVEALAMRTRHLNNAVFCSAYRPNRYNVLGRAFEVVFGLWSMDNLQAWHELRSQHGVSGLPDVQPVGGRWRVRRAGPQQRRAAAATW